MKQRIFLAATVAFSCLFSQSVAAESLPPRSPPPTPKPITVRPPANDGFYDATFADAVRKAKADSAKASKRCDIQTMRAAAYILNSKAVSLREKLSGNERSPFALAQLSDGTERHDIDQMLNASDALNAAANARADECATYGSKDDDSDESDWGDESKPNAVSVQAIVRAVNLPNLAFLGREKTAALGPVLGLFETEDQKTVAGYALGGVLGGLFSGGDAKDYKFDLKAALQHYKGKTSVLTASTDLGGDKLVIPGLGVGANGNGYVLDSFGGLNTVKDASATRTFNITAGGISLGVTKDTGGSNLRLAVGIGYEDQKQSAIFWAKVPGFVRDIMYDQHISGDIWKFGAEGSVKFRLSEGFRLGLDFSGTVRQGRYDGTNVLKFTGFADQMVHDKRSKTGFGASFGAELELKTSRNTSLKLRGDYEHVGSMPVWSTPGGGPRSRIDFGKASSVGAGFIAVIRF